MITPGHFAIGMGLGTVIMLPAFLSAWKDRRPLSRPVGRMLVLAYALGLFAIIPNLLSFAGVPQALARGVWMNLFLFNPALDQLPAGKLLSGAALVAGVSFHYLVVIAALGRQKKRS